MLVLKSLLNRLNQLEMKSNCFNFHYKKRPDLSQSSRWFTYWKTTSSLTESVIAKQRFQVLPSFFYNFQNGLQTIRHRFR